MYQPPVKGRFPQKPNNPQPIGPNFGLEMGNLTQLVMELTQLKHELVSAVDNKLQEIEKSTKEKTDNLLNAEELLQQTQQQILDYLSNVKIGPEGKPGISPNEENITKNIIKNLPKQIDSQEIVAKVLTKLPKQPSLTDLTKSVIKNIPASPANLKIIRESFETNPLTVIDQIMELAKQGKFKLKQENIDGLTQTISAFNSQLGRGYLHGGGTTIKAGAGITLVRNPDGTTTVSSAGGGGGFTQLNTADVVDGTNQTFGFSSQPTYVVSDGAWYTVGNGWTWNGTQVVMDIPPQSSIFGFK